MSDVDSSADFAAVKDDPILDLLLREYSILQDKIDKIGGFRFMIKGWVLTLNTGALVAAFATSLNPNIGMLLVSGLILGLWSLEWRQAKLSDLFQSRTLRIETKIMRRLTALGIRRIEFSTLICSPGIANELRTPIEVHRPDRGVISPLKRRAKTFDRILKSAPVLYLRRSKLWRRLREYDVHFYLLLWIVSVVFVYFQHAQTTEIRKGQPAGYLFRVPSNKVQKALLEASTWRVAEE